jgi:GNAT superfamily N-acetyltransferase
VSTAALLWLTHLNSFHPTTFRIDENDFMGKISNAMHASTLLQHGWAPAKVAAARPGSRGDSVRTNGFRRSCALAKARRLNDWFCSPGSIASKSDNTITSQGGVVQPSSAIELLAVEDQASRNAARDLITEYLQWIMLSVAARYGLSFDVDAMVKSDLNDAEKFFPPNGRFYVLRQGEDYVGVGALRRLAPGVAEIQRMYVQSHVRGLGAGRQLVEQLLSDARSIGYGVVRLESLKGLTAAHTLYRSVGFVEIEPYAENSMRAYQPEAAMQRYRASAVFMEHRF